MDPDIFKEEEEHYALTIKKQLTGKIMSSYKQLLLNKPKVRNVHTPASSPDLRVIVLSTLTSQGAASLDPSISKLISDSPDDDVKLSTHTVASTYSDMTVDSVLRRVIPESVTTEIPSSFESVGHIAHVNLRENVLPWKFIIGKVLLDKNHHITKVVNKVGQISTEFRTFPMEVIAGPDDNNFEVKVRSCLITHSQLLADTHGHFILTRRSAPLLSSLAAAERGWSAVLLGLRKGLLEQQAAIRA